MRTVFDTAELVLSPDVASTARSDLLSNFFQATLQNGLSRNSDTDVNFGPTRGRSYLYQLTRAGTNPNAGQLVLSGPVLPVWQQNIFRTTQELQDFPLNRILLGLNHLLSMRGTSEKLRTIIVGLQAVWSDARGPGGGSELAYDLFHLNLTRTSDGDTTWSPTLRVTSSNTGTTTDYTITDFRMTTGSAGMAAFSLYHSNLGSSTSPIPPAQADPSWLNKTLLEFDLPHRTRVGLSSSAPTGLRAGAIRGVTINGSRLVAYKRSGSSTIQYLPETPIELSLKTNDAQQTQMANFGLRPYVSFSFAAGAPTGTTVSVIIDRLGLWESNPPWEAESEASTVTIANGSANPVPVIEQGAPPQPVQDVNIVSPNPLPVTQRSNVVEGTPPEG